jgi:bacillithiol biosynthesis cysteine-adding enzyme BshC
MQIQALSFNDIPQLSAFDLAYQLEDSKLRPFYKYTPRLESFKELIANKDFSEEKRQLLIEVLENQYRDVHTSALVRENILALGMPSTFTVTTAHQPSLFTGPLYFIYKICGVINLCQKLNDFYPEQRFVPLYWMGGEDHDFEEINHIHLFGKKIVWDDKQGGATAHYDINSLQAVIAELAAVLGESPEALNLKKLLEESFRPGLNYGEAMFRFIDKLFARFGLIILLPDAAPLKRAMIPIFENDLLQHSSEHCVNETVAQLENLGFKNQAFARPINLFYLLPNQRERIEETPEGYRVLNTELQFSKEEILKKLREEPERFSPNVILRPLYQETVLPNLAYIGGGGELAYWLERKTQFEHFAIPFPMLIRRNSLQWVDKNSASRMEKLGLSAQDIFKDTETLIKAFIAKNTDTELSFDAERAILSAAFAQISKKAIQVDASLEPSVAAQQAQLFNALEKLETRLLRGEKQKQETELNQIRKLQEKLCLPSGLQERKENFMGLYLKQGEALLDFLVEKLNPLEKDFLVVFE